MSDHHEHQTAATAPKDCITFADAVLRFGIKAHGPAYGMAQNGALNALLGAPQVGIASTEAMAHADRVARTILHSMLQMGLLTALQGELLRSVPTDYWRTKEGAQSVASGVRKGEALYLSERAVADQIAASKSHRDNELIDTKSGTPKWESIEAFMTLCIGHGAAREVWPSFLAKLKGGEIRAAGIVQELQYGGKRGANGMISCETLPQRLLDLDRGWWIDAQGLLLPPKVRTAWLHRCPYSAEQAFVALLDALRGETSSLLFDNEDNARGAAFFAPNAPLSPMADLGGFDHVLTLDAPTRNHVGLQLLRSYGGVFSGQPYGRLAAFDIQIDRRDADKWAKQNRIATDVVERLQPAVEAAEGIESETGAARPRQTVDEARKALIALFPKGVPDQCTRSVIKRVNEWLKAPANETKVASAGRTSVRTAWKDLRQQSHTPN